MKSNEQKNNVGIIKNEVKIEQIEPYYKRDVELIRKTNQYGDVTYHRLNKTEELIIVHRRNLESEMMTLVNGLRVIEAAAESENQFQLLSVLTAVRRTAEQRIDEIFGFIEQEIGNIEINCVVENDLQDNIRCGQVVGAKIMPVDEPFEKRISEVTRMT